MHIGLHYGKHLKFKGLSHFTNFDLITFLSLLLLKCGDIEKNPGPASEYLTPSVSADTSLNDTGLRDKFSLVHCNVQSLANKRDLLFSELSNFSVNSVSETWLDQQTSDNDIALEGFKTYRRDREGDNHGGVCVYVTESIFSKRRQDLELPNLECVWVEIKTHSKKLLIGTFYRPPHAPIATITAIGDSIGMATDTNAHDILLTGDFNKNMGDGRNSIKSRTFAKNTVYLNLFLILHTSQKHHNLPLT